MHKSGDLNKNIEKLKNELRLIKFSDNIDIDLLKDGNPMVFLPILHYVFLSYSKHIAQLLLDNEYELFSKSDRDFIEKIFKALINLFNFKPNITIKQFFTNNYAEAKIIFCYDIIKIIKQENNTIIKKQYIPTNLKTVKNIKNKNNESFRSAKSSNSNKITNNIEEDFINYQYKENTNSYNKSNPKYKVVKHKILGNEDFDSHPKKNISSNNKINSKNYNSYNNEINNPENKINSRDDFDVYPTSPKFNNNDNEDNEDYENKSNNYTTGRMDYLNNFKYNTINKHIDEEINYNFDNDIEKNKNIKNIRKDLKNNNIKNEFIPNSVQNKFNKIDQQDIYYHKDSPFDKKVSNNFDYSNPNTHENDGNNNQKNSNKIKNKNFHFNQNENFEENNSNNIIDGKNKINNFSNIEFSNNNKNNFDFTSLVMILNNLGETIKETTNKIETFKSNIESRVGNIEAELAIIKNKFNIFENTKNKNTNNLHNQSLFNNNLASVQSQQEEYFFSFADENLNLTTSNSIQKNNPNYNNVNTNHNGIGNNNFSNNQIKKIDNDRIQNNVGSNNKIQIINPSCYKENIKNISIENSGGIINPNNQNFRNVQNFQNFNSNNEVPIKVFKNSDDNKIVENYQQNDLKNIENIQKIKNKKTENLENNIINYNNNNFINNNKNNSDNYNRNFFSNSLNENKTNTNNNFSNYTNNAENININNKENHSFSMRQPSVGSNNKVFSEMDDTDAIIERVANRFKETQKLLNDFK